MGKGGGTFNFVVLDIPAYKLYFITWVKHSIRNRVAVLGKMLGFYKQWLHF